MLLYIWKSSKKRPIGNISLLNVIFWPIHPGDRAPKGSCRARGMEEKSGQIRPLLSETQLFRFFLSHSSSTFNWPICLNSSSDEGSSVSAFFLGSVKMSAAEDEELLFPRSHLVGVNPIWTGDLGDCLLVLYRLAGKRGVAYNNLPGIYHENVSSRVCSKNA